MYIDKLEERSFYEHKTILFSWSSRKLKKQIKAQLYENTPKKEIQAVFQTSLPAARPQEAFKDTYDFDFIELHTDPDEKDLEDKILSNIIVKTAFI
jgi:predicted nuclease of restriction endonuclease-like (RecB) superfamily